MIHPPFTYPLIAGLLLALTTLPTLAADPAASAAPAEPVPATQVYEAKGLRIEFGIDAAYSRAKPGQTLPLMAEEFADVHFKITDATTGAPVSPLEPAVWIDLEKRDREPLSCSERLKRYTQGTLAYQAAIDLNKFFILILNNDQTISVVDPILGVNGYTQLYAMIRLASPAEDWLIANDQQRLFVTMPKAGKLASVDLDSFDVTAQIEAGTNPMRLTRQPDGRFLWVGNDSEQTGRSGVTVIDPIRNEVVATLATGRGHHEIAFADDSRTAFVTNSLDGTLTLIDIQQLRIARQIEVGRNPVAVVYSPLAQAAYVASEADGGIRKIKADGTVAAGSVLTLAGLTTLQQTPDGRWLFAANPVQNRIDIFDTASGNLVHTLQAGDRPYQFAFTDTYAYIRSLGSPNIELLRLADLGGERTPVSTSIPMGSKAPGEIPDVALASAISETGEWGTVVVSNPADQMIYYYMEGMVAPMGTFTSYGRIPRAVGILDRSLRETDKGVYSARIRIPKSGDYTVAFLVDAPWVDNCFSFSAIDNPAINPAEEKLEVQIVDRSPQHTITLGEELNLRFALRTPNRPTALQGDEEVVTLATRPPGNWQLRSRLSPGADGDYRLALKPDLPGIYLVSVAVPKLRTSLVDLPYLVFEVKASPNNQEARHVTPSQ